MLSTRLFPNVIDCTAPWGQYNWKGLTQISLGVPCPQEPFEGIVHEVARLLSLIHRRQIVQRVAIVGSEMVRTLPPPRLQI